MEKRNSFTQKEVNSLRALIKELRLAHRSKQKGIRQKMRNMGFYISEYESKNQGFNLGDFQNLLLTGKIKISDIKIEKPTTRIVPKAATRTKKESKVKMS